MNCPKAKYDGFKPDYRCCTYIPRVPNFLLGLALKYPVPRKILKKLNESGQLTPEGMHITPQQWAEYLADNAEERFGKSEVVLCPFLERSNGFCQIYAFRNSVCSTFFCMHSNGTKGDKFWDALQTLAQQSEMALSQWALEKVGFDVKAYIRRQNRLASKVEGVAKTSQPRTWTVAARKELWGDFYGREIETFEACAQVIKDHRDDLWNIANQQPILEAAIFDRASRRVVPRKYRDEIDPSDYDDGENFLPKELLRPLQASHKKLWEVPGDDKSPSAILRISSKAVVSKNLHDDVESRDFADRPFVVTCFDRATTSKKRELDWREFISTETASALGMFSKPRKSTKAVIAKIAEVSKTNGSEFMAEWIGKKILVPVKGI